MFPTLMTERWQKVRGERMTNEEAIEWVTKDLNTKGIQLDVLCPMGWFKYEEDDDETT